MDDSTVFWESRHANTKGYSADIIRLYLAEYSAIELARKYSVNIDTIFRILKKNSIHIRSNKEARLVPRLYDLQKENLKKKFSESDTADILQMYSLGYGASFIAKKYSMDCCVVVRLLQENGIHVRTSEEHNKEFKSVTTRLAMNTIIERYGGWQATHEIQKAKCLAAHGVEYSMQLKEVFDKQQHSAKRVKTAIVDGVEVQYQGYELKGLYILLDRGYKIEDIKIGKSNVQCIDYEFGGKKRKYFPDIYIPKENYLIEVKSVYTFNIAKEQNLAKQKACVAAGYKFDFMVL